MPGDTGYGCKMVDGVVHVYTKKVNMDKYVCVAKRMLNHAQPEGFNFDTVAFQKHRTGPAIP